MTDYFHLDAAPDHIRAISNLGLAHLGDAVFEVMVRSWLCLRGMESRVGWAVLSGAFGLAFGALCALVYLPVGGWQMFAATWVAGIPFDLLHGAGNFAIALVLFQPCRRVLATLCAKVFPP